MKNLKNMSAYFILGSDLINNLSMFVCACSVFCFVFDCMYDVVYLLNVFACIDLKTKRYE